MVKVFLWCTNDAHAGKFWGGLSGLIISLVDHVDYLHWVRIIAGAALGTFTGHLVNRIIKSFGKKQTSENE